MISEEILGVVWTWFDSLVHNLMDPEETTWTHRYASVGGQYIIATYKKSVSTRGKGYKGEEPDWLKHILDIALLGEYGLTTKGSVPEYIVWFETDPQLNLTKFVIEINDMTDNAAFR
jgi:hypothetical protein